MSRELKKYRLRATRKPMLNPYVASAVQVSDEEGRSGYCYIGFDEPFVQAVGKKMPRGVAVYDPAHLYVEYSKFKKKWIITCCYLSDMKMVVLWESDTRPTWVNLISYGVKNGRPPTDKTGTGAGNVHHSSKT